MLAYANYKKPFPPEYECKFQWFKSCRCCINSRKMVHIVWFHMPVGHCPKPRRIMIHINSSFLPSNGLSLNGSMNICMEEASRCTLTIICSHMSSLQQNWMLRGRDGLQALLIITALFQDICDQARVKKLQTTSFHPHTNGQCERFNRTLIQMIGTLPVSSKQNWQEWMHMLTIAVPLQ